MKDFFKCKKQTLCVEHISGCYTSDCRIFICEQKSCWEWCNIFQRLRSSGGAVALLGSESSPPPPPEFRGPQSVELRGGVGDSPPAVYCFSESICWSKINILAFNFFYLLNKVDICIGRTCRCFVATHCLSYFLSSFRLMWAQKSCMMRLLWLLLHLPTQPMPHQPLR